MFQPSFKTEQVRDNQNEKGIKHLIVVVENDSLIEFQMMDLRGYGS